MSIHTTMRPLDCDLFTPERFESAILRNGWLCVLSQFGICTLVYSCNTTGCMTRASRFMAAGGSLLGQTTLTSSNHKHTQTLPHDRSGHSFHQPPFACVAAVRRRDCWRTEISGCAIVHVIEKTYFTSPIFGAKYMTHTFPLLRTLGPTRWKRANVPRSVTRRHPRRFWRTHRSLIGNPLYFFIPPLPVSIRLF